MTVETQMQVWPVGLSIRRPLRPDPPARADEAHPVRRCATQGGERVETFERLKSSTKEGQKMGAEDFEDKVKQEIEDRGGTDALEEDATEVKDDITEQGSLSDKVKDVFEDVKDPGAPGN
jgi:hypothetical protein